ncbi:MAG: PadR family transcriptional regulator, partial [Actinobacteria bacterium]|nr:PadR family transcriptional regulator [Actinomycetota bacterium]
MKKLTTTSYAILGLLAIRPWSAYALSQQMRRNVGDFWPRAERGIYDEPKNLVAHGYATSADEEQGRRSRTVYAITPAGRRALRAWLAESSAPPQFESEALLRIAFAEHGHRRAALDTLASLRADAEERRRSITDVARSYVEGAGPYPERIHTISLVTRFFADYYDLLETWATWAAAEIESWEHISHPPSPDGPHETLAEIAALRPAKP